VQSANAKTNFRNLLGGALDRSPTEESGAGVLSSRGLIRYVVTEYGVA
jgi:hypothetical protein